MAQSQKSNALAPSTSVAAQPAADSTSTQSADASTRVSVITSQGPKSVSAPSVGGAEPLLLSHKQMGAGAQTLVPIVEATPEPAADVVVPHPSSAATSETTPTIVNTTATPILDAHPSSVETLAATPVEATPIESAEHVEAVPVGTKATAFAPHELEALQAEGELPDDASVQIVSGLQHAFAEQFAKKDGATAHAAGAAGTAGAGADRAAGSSRASQVAAMEAALLLKDLDVLKKVKEFNAQEHKNRDAARGGAVVEDDDFYHDYDYDDSDELSDMHVVHGDEDAGDDDLHFDRFNFGDSTDGYDYDDDEITVSSDPNAALLGDSASDVDMDADEVEAEVIPSDDERYGAATVRDMDNAGIDDTGAGVPSSRALVRVSGRSSVGSTLGAMIKAAQREPMLSEEEEKELARRYKQNDDLEAAWRLVMSHMRLVMSVARKFTGYGLPLLDLIQEGNIGLMKAVKNFDPDAGVRLAAFAAHHIRSEIFEYVICNWRMVKVATTKSQRSIFFKLRQAKKHLGWMNDSEREQLANLLGVSAKEVAVMETRMAGSDIGFDLEDSDSDKGTPVTLSPSSYLEDENSNFSQVVESLDYARWEKQKLYEALATLDERAQYIMKRRWLDEEKATFQELSQELKISIERVRQLENNAMKKIKSVLLASGVNAEDEASAESAVAEAPEAASASGAAARGRTRKTASSKEGTAKDSSFAGSLLCLPDLTPKALPYKAAPKDDTAKAAASTKSSKKSCTKVTRTKSAKATNKAKTTAAKASGTKATAGATKRTARKKAASASAPADAAAALSGKAK